MNSGPVSKSLPPELKLDGDWSDPSPTPAAISAEAEAARSEASREMDKLITAGKEELERQKRESVKVKMEMADLKAELSGMVHDANKALYSKLSAAEARIAQGVSVDLAGMDQRMKTLVDDNEKANSTVNHAARRCEGISKKLDIVAGIAQKAETVAKDAKSVADGAATEVATLKNATPKGKGK